MTHLDYLQSVLRKFDADCALLEALLGQYFYEGFRPLIKLWIDEKGREQFVEDDLVKKIIRAKVKAKL